MINKRIACVITILAIIQIACMGILGVTEEFPEESRPVVQSTDTSAPEEIEPQPTTAPTEPQPTEQAEEPAETTDESESSSDTGVETVEGMCSHPYYPINEDYIWTYEITDASAGPSYYTVEFKDVMEDNFILFENFYEAGNDEILVTIEMKWLCTEEGLVSTEYGQLDVFSQGQGEEGMPGFVYETLEADGINLPVPDNWEIGSTWESNFLLRGISQIEGVGEITSTAEIKIENEIVGIESITVEAGTFDDAVKIDGTTTITSTMFVMGMSTPFTVTVDTETWYVENIGLVKTMERDFASVTELISLEEK